LQRARHVTQVGQAASRSRWTPHAVTLAQGEECERACCGSRRSEIPVGDMLAGEDHVRTDLTAEPDDDDLLSLLVDGAARELGEHADDRVVPAGPGARTVRAAGVLTF